MPIENTFVVETAAEIISECGQAERRVLTACHAASASAQYTRSEAFLRIKGSRWWTVEVGGGGCRKCESSKSWRTSQR